jgi:flagellar FliL protein
MAKSAHTENGSSGKSKLTLILIVALVVVAGAGGFFAWQFLAAPTKAEDEQAAGEAAEAGEEEEAADAEASHGAGQEKESGILSFEPFLVNLADTDASRYLRVTIRVAVKNKAKAETIALTDTLMSKTRDAILDTLSGKASGEIITRDGKEQLKSELVERLNSFLPNKPVSEIYFTDFVVQL